MAIYGDIYGDTYGDSYGNEYAGVASLLTLNLASWSAGWSSDPVRHPLNADDGDLGTAARGTSSGTYQSLVYGLGGSAIVTRIRVNTGGGSLTFDEWYAEYWDGSAWQQLFAPTAVPNPADFGWHEVRFPAQQTTSIRIQVVYSANDVQLDMVEVYGVQADELAPVIALAPTFLYRPTRPLVTVAAAATLVTSAIADDLDSGTASKDLVQATAGSQPAWLGTSSAPSQVPALRGDGTDDHLQGAGASAAAVCNLHTIYALMVRPVSAGQEAACGIGSTTLALWHSFGLTGSAGLSRRAGLGNITAGTFAAGETFWVESRRDASSNTITVTGGATATGAQGSTFTPDLLTMCANRNSTGIIEQSDAEVLAYVGFNSILSAGDRAIVRAALSAYAGI